MVRTSLPPSQVVESLRASVRAIDPGMPLYNVRTLAEHVDRSLSVDRLRANLVGALALLALALAAIGIYAVLSYTIAERTREVGVRLALGAQPRAVLRLLIGSGARVAAIGIAAGLAIAAVLTRYVEAQLYGLSPLDPLDAGRVVRAAVRGSPRRRVRARVAGDADRSRRRVQAAVKRGSTVGRRAGGIPPARTARRRR